MTCFSLPNVRRRALMLACLMAATACFSPADAGAAVPPLGAEAPTIDVDQTIACRRLLREDPILGPLNLGIKVEKGVAVLWGPAPSQAVRRRAEECLRTMIELMDVKNLLYIDPLADWDAPAAEPNPPAIGPDIMPPILPKPLRQLLPQMFERAELARNAE